MVETIPAAIHRGKDDLPWVDIGEGSLMQVLHIDVEQGMWVVRNRFQPGYVVPTHKHTGTVYAFTVSGSWKYREYPEVNTAGSYLFEPAGSIHTLTVPDTNNEVTEVSFVVWGANLNLDADGNVQDVWDAEFIRDAYYMMCEAEGHPKPDIILREQQRQV